MYGNKNDIDEKTILDLLRDLDIFKEESNYDLTKIISNKTLSSGQMQKIAFVRALLNDSDILLLDEATSNLDETTKDKIFKILKERKITIVNSTHDPNSFKNVDHNLRIKLVDEKRIVDIHKL